MSGHTPTPYFAPEQADWRHRCVTVMARGGAVQVAVCYANQVSRQEAIANAEFIVRACNSHDELLAALKACVEIYDWCLDASRALEDIDRIARAAIRRAEGGAA